MFGLGGQELILILLIILLLFGAKKLPELAITLEKAGASQILLWYKGTGWYEV